MLAGRPLLPETLSTPPIIAKPEVVSVLDSVVAPVTESELSSVVAPVASNVPLTMDPEASHFCTRLALTWIRRSPVPAR